MNDQPIVAVDDDLDVDAWIDGVHGMTAFARIIGRGDLLAVRDRLARELEAARRIPAGQRGLDDMSAESIEAQLEEVSDQLAESILVVTILDRGEAHREEIRTGLKKKGVKDRDVIGLHVTADSIIKVEAADGRVRNYPEGFPPEKLRQIRDRGGDSAMIEVATAFKALTSQAPTVTAPLSPPSSSNRGGHI